MTFDFGPEREFFDRHLRSFVPPGSFDAHAHLYRRADALPLFPPHLEDAQHNVGIDRWEHALDAWMGDRRPTAGLFFAVPKKDGDRPAANRFEIEEVRKRPGNRGLLLIAPGDDPAAVEAEVDHQNWAGFKVYHVYAARPDTFEAETGEFLPEWAWEIAHDRDLAIMLHLVRARALSDPHNQTYIREHCLKYPGARLILAHAARGFNGAHTAEGIGGLRGLDNVYFDTSAACEPEAMAAIARATGTGRLMFGTDFPVSEMVGRAVNLGDGFFWLYAENVDWRTANLGRPRLVGIESLLAVQRACRDLRLTDSDVERIFVTNAREMLGVARPAEGEQTQALYERAKRLIPGGTQLLSKRPEMFAPGRWPAYFREAAGCEVTDLDGRRFIDMTTSGIGACLLGHNHPDVTAAVVRRVTLGSMSTLNPPEEVELAELLVGLHPWAEQARFTRTGGEAMAVAVRLARAASGRDRVAFCGYHGWSDWYLAANLQSEKLTGHLLPGLAPAGVPSGLAGTAIPFAYNRIDELKRIVSEHGSQLAAVVMEPTRSTDPEPGFLESVRELCDACGAALVFDEITAGWRLFRGGVHLKYGVAPDVAVFAKALGNGHPVAAVIGRRRVMDAAQTSFVSSTYWTDGVGPAAAVATVRAMLAADVPAHVARIGRTVQDGWRELGRRHGVAVKAGGHPALTTLAFDHDHSAALGTLFTVRMLDRGFLAGGGFYPTLAHDERHVAAYLAAADAVFPELADAARAGDATRRLGGRVRHAGFARLT
jgi:glutamate-1-semialdehyde 2,1-aminomutase